MARPPRAHELARKQIVDFDRDDRLATAFARLSYDAATPQWNKQRRSDPAKRTGEVTEAGLVQ